VKTVISFKIDTDLKAKLEKLGKEENRSLSNLIETILMKYAKTEKKTQERKK
jgi:predicted transcriptional regulator